MDVNVEGEFLDLPAGFSPVALRARSVHPENRSNGRRRSGSDGAPTSSGGRRTALGTLNPTCSLRSTAGSWSS